MLIGANLQGPRRYIRTHQMKNLCYEPVDLRRVRADGSIDYAAKVGVAPGTMSMWSHGGYPGTENVAALFGIYKPGLWHVRWEGGGRVDVVFAKRNSESEHLDTLVAPNERVIDLIFGTGDPIELTIILKGDVRNLVVVHEDYVDTYDTDPWLPEYVDEIKRMGWRVLRFDDDSAYPTSWAQRRKPGDLLGKTICLEHRVALCNAVGAHLWFICQGVESEYWLGALDIIDGLNDWLETYWEVRNEVWNAGHPVIGANYRVLRDLLPQYPEITGVNEYQRVMRLHAHLTVRLGQFLNDIDESHAVLSGQHGNPGITRDGLSFEVGLRDYIDYIAPASYMYEAHSATVDWNTATQSLQTAKNRNSAWASLAQEFGKTVVWYEGGNHHNSGLTNNAEFASDPRGANLVSQMLDDAEAKGVMLACAYQHGQPGVNEWAFDSSTALGQMYQERNGAAEPLPEPEPVPEPEPTPEPEPEPQRPVPPTGLRVIDSDRLGFDVDWVPLEPDAGIHYVIEWFGDLFSDVRPPEPLEWPQDFEGEADLQLWAVDSVTNEHSDTATLTIARPPLFEPEPSPDPEGPTLQDVLDAVVAVNHQNVLLEEKLDIVRGVLKSSNELLIRYDDRFERLVDALFAIQSGVDNGFRDAVIGRDGVKKEILAAINARRVITGEVTAVDAEGPTG